MQMESPTMFLNCWTQHNKDGDILKILIYKLLLKINSKQPETALWHCKQPPNLSGFQQ